MSRSTDIEQPAHENPTAPANLPPVEPPSASFLLQLFIVPLIIVSIIVALWLMFSWVAHLGSDPKTLVTDMKRLDQSSWQKAMTLADLLRHPEYDHLKEDDELAGELASFLEQQISLGSMEKNSVKMRMFLCRALGEFRTPVVAEVLCKAATTDRDSRNSDAIEINVRLSAMEGLALLGKNVGPEVLRANPKVLESLLISAKEPGDDQDSSKRANNRSVEANGKAGDQLDLQTPRAELRAVAAFAIGVLGGDEGLERLYQMTQGDPYYNARYNAAIGLARHGDIRAMDTLIEMLDPENPEAVQDEAGESEREEKRVMVINNAIRAARKLFEKNTEGDLTRLVEALKQLQSKRLPRIATQEAQELLLTIHQEARN